MSPWKRFGLLVTLTLCVIFLLVSIVFIIGSWYLRPAIIEGLQDTIQIVDRALEQSIVYLDALDGVLTESQNTVDRLQTTLEATAAGLKDRAVALRETIAIRETLEPLMNDITEFTQGMREAYIAFDTSIQGLNRLPFIEIETPGAALIQSITDTRTNLQNQINNLEDSIQGLATLSDETISQLDAILLATQTSLNQYQEHVSKFQEVILNLQSEVDLLESRISSGVTWLTIGITLIFMWIALGQVAFFLFAWSFLKGHDPRTVLR